MPGSNRVRRNRRCVDRLQVAIGHCPRSTLGKGSKGLQRVLVVADRAPLVHDPTNDGLTGTEDDQADAYGYQCDGHPSIQPNSSTHRYRDR